jgi:hypothetical protein
MAMMIAAASGKKPSSGNVHDETAGRDQNRLVEMDRHRRKKSQPRLIADNQSDHRKDEGARKTGEIAKLSRAEHEAGTIRVPPRVGISRGRDQERQGVGCHMKAIGDHGERPKQGAARDFRDHHDSRERNRGPSPALVRRMAGAKEIMAVFAGRRGVLVVHDRPPRRSLRPHLK